MICKSIVADKESTHPNILYCIVKIKRIYKIDLIAKDTSPSEDSLLYNSEISEADSAKVDKSRSLCGRHFVKNIVKVSYRFRKKEYPDSFIRGIITCLPKLGKTTDVLQN